mgnify:CR=1 FL=1
MKTFKPDLLEIVDASAGTEIDLTQGILTFATTPKKIHWNDVLSINVTAGATATIGTFTLDLTAGAGYTPQDDQEFPMEIRFNDPDNTTIKFGPIVNGNTASGTALTSVQIANLIMRNIGGTDLVTGITYPGYQESRVTIQGSTAIQDYGVSVTDNAGALTFTVKRFWDPTQQHVGGPVPIAGVHGGNAMIQNAASYYGAKAPEIEQYSAEIIIIDAQTATAGPPPSAGSPFVLVAGALMVDPSGTIEIMTYYADLFGETPGVLPLYDTIEIKYKVWIKGGKHGHQAYKEETYLGFSDPGGALSVTVGNIQSATGYLFTDYVLVG